MIKKLSDQFAAVREQRSGFAEVVPVCPYALDEAGQGPPQAASLMFFSAHTMIWGIVK